MPKKLTFREKIEKTFNSIFWGWNIIFLLMDTFIFYFFSIPLLLATILGEIPLDFSLTILALMIMPILSILLAKKHFDKQPRQLMRFFYGVEAPLFVLCLIRLFLIRELTPVSGMFLATICLCIAAFCGELLYGYVGFREDLTEQTIKNNNFWARLIGQEKMAWLQMGCHSLMLIIGLYAATILFFYALPVAVSTVNLALQFVGGIFYAISHANYSWENISYMLLSSLPFLLYMYLGWWLFIFSGGLFVAMPSLFGFLYLESGQKILRDFASQYGKPKMRIASVSIITTWLVIFLSLQNQPQIKALQLLETPANSDIRPSLIAQSDKIKEGLVNAYLSPYRYLSTVKENDHIRVMYQWLGLSKDAGQTLQNWYNYLMSPFLYQGSQSDVEKAEKLYEAFFDKPIQKGETNAIQHALQSTYERDQVQAGLLNINEKKVWLQSQDIAVKEKGNFAEVALHEVYQNQTNELQEIFYYFSLPESATVTGLWLGDTADISKAFPFTVSPRGAAQKVYNSQVRVERQDPALLEQVGPKNYRLRAFPIPAKQVLNNNWFSPDRAKVMHLWLTYKVMAEEKGWSLPTLAEKRNIFWTEYTQRNYTINGVKYAEKIDKNNWLPEYFPLSKKIAPTLQEVIFSGGEKITAKPLTNSDYVLPNNQKFAVILDTSYSMTSQRQKVQETLEGLTRKKFGDNDIDIYISSSPGMAPQRVNEPEQFKLSQLSFYGSLSFNEMLQQFATLRREETYNGIFLISDRGNYELSKDKEKIPSLGAPLWMIHLGGMPPAYDDNIFKAIQDSGGGVGSDIKEVMQRLATKAKLGKSTVNVVDGYTWINVKLSPRDLKKLSPLKKPEENEFSPLAARQLVLALSKETSLEQVSQLDGIHAIAKQFKIVTPYSSMIVLVNDRQRELLKEAEAQRDRFERQVESGKETLTKPANPMNQEGIPEPQTWLGLILGIGLLIIFRYRQQRHNPLS